MLSRWAGDSVYMPITRFLVDHAASATALDAHMLGLGWPNDVARGMRSAFKMKKLDPKGWQLMGESDERPSGVFSFGQEYDCLPGYLGATHFGLLGTTVELLAMPLVSEFQVMLPADDDRGFLTSFDGFGDQGNLPVIRPTELMKPLGYCSVDHYGVVIPDSGVKFGVGRKDSFGHVGIHANGGREWNFGSRSVWYYPTPGCIPRLAKHVQIEHEFHDDWSEHVSLIFFMDLGPERGKILPPYKGGQFLTYQLRRRLASGVTALVEIKYEMTDDGGFSAVGGHNTPIRVVCDSFCRDREVGSSIRLLESSEIMPRLCDAVGRLYAHSSYPHWLRLGKIVGEGILRNPPATLLERFAAPD